MVTSLADLEDVGNKLHCFVQTTLETIWNSRLRNKLHGFLGRRERPSLHLDDSSREVAVAPAQGPLHGLVSFINKSVLPSISGLTEENYISTIMFVAREVAAAFERFLRALPNCDGALVANLVQDLRKANSFFADLTELQSKDLFVRSLQMLRVLDHETLSDARKTLEGLAGKEEWQLSSGEVESLLGKRTDW